MRQLPTPCERRPPVVRRGRHPNDSPQPVFRRGGRSGGPWQAVETGSQSRQEARAAQEARRTQIQQSLQRGQQREIDKREEDRAQDKNAGSSY